ncbi:hypothetical protein KC19_12G104600 [Ceratodon purpureus]|uniref:Uncharacterized protein n=1 Tax=Ceratodon purpureus TaxID=3225 RepID=A0A8T0G825_CERPU|nr:hypothetical protein KC19_12G104600 [Ceratodon purpureus]
MIYLYLLCTFQYFISLPLFINPSYHVRCNSAAHVEGTQQAKPILSGASYAICSPCVNRNAFE